jgi:hypothetical protein
MEPAILKNHRIHELSTLYATLRQEIQVAAVIQKIEALFSHHEAPAT